MFTLSSSIFCKFFGFEKVSSNTLQYVIFSNLDLRSLFLYPNANKYQNPSNHNNFNGDVSAPTNEEEFETKTEVRVCFGLSEYDNYILADYMIEDIKPFIKRLKKDKYSNLSILE